jgi:hypothetical protein
MNCSCLRLWLADSDVVGVAFLRRLLLVGCVSNFSLDHLRYPDPGCSRWSWSTSTAGRTTAVAAATTGRSAAAAAGRTTAVTTAATGRSTGFNCSLFPVTLILANSACLLNWNSVAYSACASALLSVWNHNSVALFLSFSHSAADSFHALTLFSDWNHNSVALFLSFSDSAADSFHALTLLLNWHVDSDSSGLGDHLRNENCLLDSFPCSAAGCFAATAAR